MLVSAKEMLDKAVEGHYAVGQFNINNLEWTKSILLTAEELKSPVILGVSEGAGKYMTGFKTVAAMVKAMMEELNITVLHVFTATGDIGRKITGGRGSCPMAASETRSDFSGGFY